MANFTKKEIKKSFVKLLKSKKLKDITVKDIVEDCEINRNSFYYHYQDIPSLLKELLKDKIDEILQSHQSINSIQEGFDIIESNVIDNKKIIFNIYNSLNRDVLVNSLSLLCDYIAKKYVDCELFIKNEKEKSVITEFIKYMLLGIIIDWLNDSNNEDKIINIREYLQTNSKKIADIKKIFIEN